MNFLHFLTVKYNSSFHYQITKDRLYKINRLFDPRKISEEKIKEYIGKTTGCTTISGTNGYTTERYFFSTESIFYEIFLVWTPCSKHYQVMLWKGDTKGSLSFRDKKIGVYPENLNCTVKNNI